MENNLENKLKFYALYLGQAVVTTPRLIWSGNPPEPSHEEWGDNSIRVDNIEQLVKHDFPLELKSLANITDEDKLWIIRNIHYNHVKFENPNPIDLWEDEFVYDGWTVDFLRSRGYAVPFMGRSVEDMVSWGWVILV